MKEGVAGVSEDELLLGDICWIFEEESRREAVLGVCEDEEEEADGADSLVE